MPLVKKDQKRMTKEQAAALDEESTETFRNLGMKISASEMFNQIILFGLVLKFLTVVAVFYQYQMLDPNESGEGSSEMLWFCPIFV